jgi:hypothetical protein
MIPRTTMMPITTRIPTPTISPITYFKIEDPAGINNGNYKNISFSQFGINDRLNNWTINIIFTSTSNKASYTGIIGNCYNTQVPGWPNGFAGASGFWLTPGNTQYVHFRLNAWNQDFPSLGTINNNIPHKLIINFNDGIYKLTLINLTTNTSNTVDIKDKPKFNSTTGNITIGGHWPDGSLSEKFDGSINYVDFTSIPTSSFNYPLSGNNIWADDDANVFTCPYSPGVRKEVGGWCVLSNENDAKNLCNLDPTCTGYVTSDPKVWVGFQLVKKTQNTPGWPDRKFYKKTPSTA